MFGRIPCYVSSVQGLIFPVCRVWLLVCSEGVFRQGLDVLEPDTATPGVRSSTVFWAAGQEKVREEAGGALTDLSGHTFHGGRDVETRHFALHAARRELRTATPTCRTEERTPAPKNSLKT